MKRRSFRTGRSPDSIKAREALESAEREGSPRSLLYVDESVNGIPGQRAALTRLKPDVEADCRRMWRISSHFLGAATLCRVAPDDVSGFSEADRRSRSLQ